MFTINTKVKNDTARVKYMYQYITIWIVLSNKEYNCDFYQELIRFSEIELVLCSHSLGRQPVIYSQLPQLIFNLISYIAGFLISLLEAYH